MLHLAWYVYVYLIFETAIAVLAVIVIISLICQTIEHVQDKKIAQLQIKKEIEEIIRGIKTADRFLPEN